MRPVAESTRPGALNQESFGWSRDKSRPSALRELGDNHRVPPNTQVPLGELAKLSFSKGATMIRDEDAALTGYVYRGPNLILRPC